MSELIDGVTKQWKWNIFREMFASNEAAKISTLYVSKLDCPHELVWYYDNKGHYTVKSGYQLLYNIKGTASNQEDVQLKAVWERICSTPVPKKIQIFP